MATRKQRARRAKTFRHDYGFVMHDEEGNEIDVPGAEVRAKKDGDAKPGAKPAAKSGSGSSGRQSTKRSAVEPRPPSWNRALKRGGVWGLGAGVVITFLLHGPIALGLLYAAMFVPLTYWTDGIVYRRWQKKHGSGPPSRPGKTR